ncbi:MAG: hypothetical protein ABIN48_13750 [Ginsengibacter sp.]
MTLSIIGSIILTAIVVIYILISWKRRMKAKRDLNEEEEDDSNP